jgi:hypothetical protein
MKQILCAVALLGLAGCSINKGLSDALPKLNSHTGKNVAAYVECLQPKWAALTGDVDVVKKGEQARVDASDKKIKGRERLDVVADAAGAQVMMYEVQGTYDSRYRDEAISCL